MLSKILVIVNSLLLIVVSMATFSHIQKPSLSNFFVPNMDKMDFASPIIIIFIVIGLFSIVFSFLFGSLESKGGGSGSIDKLINFINSGMNPANGSQLDQKGVLVVNKIDEIMQQRLNQTSQQLQSQIQQLQSQNSSLKQELEQAKSAPAVAPIGSGTDFGAGPSDFGGGFNFDSNRTQEEENKDGFGDNNLLDNDGGFGPADFSDFSEEEDSSKGAATVIASIPEELLRQSQKNYKAASLDPDEDYKKVYKDYYNMKLECGESVAGLTEQAFVNKLKTTENSLKNKQNCTRVEFSVYKKDNKAALKATPKFN